MSAQTTPRERRQQRTRRAILDAARQIINQKGPEALSMRALARRIDYSPAGLYEYFDGKEAIVAAVCAEGHALLAGRMATVDTALDPASYLQGLGEAYIAFARQHPDYFVLMFSAADVAEARDLTEPTSSFGYLLQGVERAVTAGLLQTGDGQVLTIAYGLWSLVHGIAMLRITQLRDVDLPLDDFDRLTLRAALRGWQ